MRRRDFIVALGGGWWPFVARAQQGQPMHRVGMLMVYHRSDPEGHLRAVVFQQELEKLGWTIDGNLQVDYYWGVDDYDWARSAVAELLNSAPDVIVANGSPAIKVVQESSRIVAIIFIGSADPIADGFVRTLAHPGGNMTGFTVWQPGMGAKMLQLLREIAPRVARVGILLNPNSSSAPRIFGSAADAQQFAQQFAVELVAVPVRDAAEIEGAIPGGESVDGLIVPPDPFLNTHRKLISELAARHRLPTIYALRAAAVDGGLMSYGVYIPDLFRGAAAYANRIMRGEKPADLPVQQPTKFELVINLNSANALGLTVPLALLATADEVID
jgi:putative ABC transport system substrate-binding protein